MRTAKGLIGAATTVMVLAGLPGLALAATAHNSQAGAYGSTKNNCAATPYFPAGPGCLSTYIERYQDDGAVPPPRDVRARYRPRPPLQ